jgi:hypothetical protein
LASTKTPVDSQCEHRPPSVVVSCLKGIYGFGSKKKREETRAAASGDQPLASLDLDL